MFKHRFVLLVLLSAILLISVSFTNVGAYTWYMEDSGDASSTTYWGFPESTISQYASTEHSLLLGVIANVYASATARGSMWVEAVATTEGWVTASMYWYLRGDLGGGGLGFYDAYITVKFRVYDKTAQASSDTVLLDHHLVWGDYGTWRLDNIDVPLYNAHIYVFSLDVEVHAHSEGLSAVIADFGGIWWEDSKIEWGYLDVPNTILHGGGGHGGGGSLCPTLFVWSGTDYVEEGLLNIHADSDITVQDQIQNTLALENGVYKLQLRELDNFTSHIDQVKLYAVDSEGEWHLCPLTYAYHSELGKVTWKLFFDDEKRVALTPTQTIDLKFLPSIPYGKTVDFIFELNGYNRKALL